MKPFPYSPVRALFLLACLWCPFSIFAQETSEETDLRNASFLLKKVVVPTTPEAASLGKYGDAQVNFYTGALNLQIPIHTIQGKDLSHGIALSYDGSGNKVDNLPTWVGLGWTLQAGGVITRAVVANPDLEINYFSKASTIDQFLVQNTDMIADYDFMYKVVKAEIETQPDNFYFNFGAYSGKFYISPYKLIYQKEKRDVEITPSFDGNGDITSFVIKDELGNVYEFAATERTTHILDDDYGNLPPSRTQYTYNSSWYLTKITNATGTEVIDLTYESLSLPFTPPINANSYESMTYGDGTTATAGPGCPTVDVCPIGPSYTYSGIASVSISNRKFLTSISYKQGGVVLERLDFTSSSNTYPYAYGGKKLDKITLLRGTGGAMNGLIDYRFSYSGATNRLTLTSFQETQYNNTGVAKQPYLFTYNTSYQLPSPTSSSIDHWGYYNTNSGSGSLIPSVTIGCGAQTFYGGGAVRDPDSDLMKAGILTRIQYPTSGYTDFVFEPHKVAAAQGACSTDDRLAGGLRIKEIKNYDHSGALLTTRSYLYIKEGFSPNAPNASSGLMLTEPEYVTSSSYTQYPRISYPEDCDIQSASYSCSRVTLYASSRSVLGSVQGSHVGYSRVEELFAGKTVYHYRNTALSSEYEDDNNGDLLKQEVFNDQGRKLAETKFTYEADTTVSSLGNHISFKGMIVEASSAQDNKTIICKVSDNYYVWKLNCCENPICPGITYTARSKWQRRAYFLRQTWKRRIRTTETRYFYNDSGVLTAQVGSTLIDTFGNANVTQPTYSLMTNSDGVQYKTLTKFAHDLNHTTLIGFRIIGVPLVQETYAGTTQVAGTKTEYSLFDASGNPTTTPGSGNKPYPYKFYNYEMTWTNGAPTSGAWVLKGTVKTMYAATGLIKSMRKEGWAHDELYEWESGQVKKRTFNAFVWEYSYYASSRLLYTIKDVDGQITTFKYDGLMRLDSALARGGNVKTKYQYQYKDASNPRNFVRTSTTFTPVGGSNLTQQQTWQYLDGLGRPIQTVRWRHQPTRGANDQLFGYNDIATAQEYDAYGRVVKTYVPYQSAYEDGSYMPVTGGTPFSTTQYENSPLSRVTSVTPPGGYATATAYGANTAAIAIPGASVTYPAGSLFETKTTDPDGRVSLTYKDKRDRLVLSRVLSGSANADTYYQYDGKDRLIRVIPPGATATSADLIYTYEYDAADRLVKKKVPGMGYQYLKYNTRDLLVFSRDSNLVAANQCLGYKYDDYGRILESGLVAGFPADPNAAFTFAESQIKTYYDGFDGSTQLSLTTYPQYRGRVRRTESRVLGSTGGGTWLHTTFTYDAYGRTTQTQGNNYLNTASASAETVASTYDYADFLITSTRTHQPGAAAGTGNQTLRTDYWNDHTGRKTGVLLQHNAGATTHLAEYNYDFRERLIERNLHAGLYGSTWGWLQSVDYAYNDQDWLTAINTKNATGSSLALSATCSPSMPNPGSTPLVKHPEDNDLFYLELRYDQLFATSSATGGTISGLSGTLQKGGNIAQMAWRVRGRERQAYAFTYDTLSRLKTASYFDVNTSGTATASNRFNETLTYDLRGNIGTLQRQGFIQSTCTFGQIDNLAYTYAAGTNRLTSVADASGKTEGFKPGSGAGYTYDGNGNLKSDSYKSISSITYNHLNLPKLITFSSGNTIEIVYDASGNKLRKIVKQGATVQYEQDYSGGIEYRKTPAAGTFRIEAIYHEEGRYFNLNVDVNNTPSWRKEYALRDHLGSTRLLFADKDGDGMVEVTSNPATNEIIQENHYYPFGLSYGGSHWMNDAARDNGYKYNGKELNEDWGLGWYDYGARWYMPDLGRWGAVDPLAEKFSGWSPFHYAMNNPIRFLDLFGMMAYRYDWEDERYEDEKGREVSWTTVYAQISGKTDLNAYIRNTVPDRIGSQDLIKSFSYASNIFAKNGITNVRYHLLSDEEAEQFQPQWYDAFLNIVYTGYVDEGGEANHTDGIPEKSPKYSFVNLNFSELQGRTGQSLLYGIGYLIAHESLHFFLRGTYLKVTGDWVKYSSKKAHENSEPNLLMHGHILYKDFGGIPKGPSNRLQPAEKIREDHMFWLRVLVAHKKTLK